MRSLAIALLLAAAIPATSQTPAAAQVAPPAPPSQVAIQVDLAKSLGPYQHIGSWFGYDEINFTTGKYGSQLLPELHDLSHAPVYIRAHHLFTSGDGQPKLKWSSTNVFSLDASGKPVYNFTILDQIFDEYQRASVRPMVELGFMPKDLASGAMAYEMPYPNTIKGAVQSPPKDYAMWGELVRRVVEHFVQRYGRDQVATWYFEVWNEPDIAYWQGTPEQYMKLYDYAVAGVRKALPTALSEPDPEGGAACSAKQNPNNAYRNSPVYPTYTAAAMKALVDLVAENKVNLIGMVTWAFEFEGKQYFEGFRTLATNGIDKPVLNIFRMAGLFSGDRVSAVSSSEVPAEDIAKSGVRAQPDVDAFATKSTHEAVVMVWNYHDEDLPVPATQVTVKISGIPAGVSKVLLEHFRIDDTHSNAYTVWVAMGSPQDPTPDQYAQLKAAGQLQTLTSPTWLNVTSGSVTVTTTLPREATSLLHLTW